MAALTVDRVKKNIITEKQLFLGLKPGPLLKK